MKKILLLFAAIALYSCSGDNKAIQVKRAFYCWKSNTDHISHKEDSLIRDVGVKKLYIKFFEVERSDISGNIPVAKTRMYDYDEYDIDSVSVIPTVYLDNKIFIQSSREELDTLVNNVSFLTVKYSKRFGKAISGEWQMDCDWTLKSRDNYFYFLRQLKKISGKQISCTLRLYPYKYPEKMGVPPVDKAMLMCYNLVNPLENEDMNSILDEDELKLYLDKKRKYPLHLDVALPVFSWMQLYQNNRFKGIIYPGNQEYILSKLQKIKPLWYEFIEDEYVDGTYVRAGDRIKYESISAEKLNNAISIIKEHVKLDDNTTIALFHLDEQQLKTFSHEKLSGFYSAFSE